MESATKKTTEPDRLELGVTVIRTAYDCMHISKSIRLNDEAYERLAAHKREDETFSDVVVRLAGERSLLELAGILTDEQADDLEAAIEERRERRTEELESIAGRMEN